MALEFFCCRCASAPTCLPQRHTLPATPTLYLLAALVGSSAFLRNEYRNSLLCVVDKYCRCTPFFYPFRKLIMTVKNKIAIAIAALCCATSAMAADDYPSWYVGGSAVGAKPDADFGAGNRGYGASLRVGNVLSESWDLQLGTSYMLARENDHRYRQNTLGGEMLYMLSRKSVRPYLALGAGAEFDKTRSRFSSTDRLSPYASAGVGVQMDLNEKWSLQADVRKVHGYLRSNEFGFNQASNNYVGIGLNYAFDKPAPTLRPVAVVHTPDPLPEPVAVMAPPPSPVVPAPVPRFEKVTLSATELFAFNSAVLAMPQAKLDEIVLGLKADMRVNNVVITGYADRIGSTSYNLNLSEQRANSVKIYLTERGIDSGRMSAVGRGEENPVVSCNQKKRADLIVCLEPNRRVEIEQITIERRLP